MGRKCKPKESELEAVKRFLFRDYNQELEGQSKLKHYRETKDEIIFCAICSAVEVKLHRHRIIPGGIYHEDNIVVCCVPCHKVIHKMYRDTNAKCEMDYRIAILLVESERGKK